MFFNFSKKPIIHLYTICWNEEYLLENYFFRHYDPLVQRYIFFDNGSTDQTIAILKRHPKVEIRRLQGVQDKDSYVLSAQDVHNQCWKESRASADWVIITAVDEFLYAPGFRRYLAEWARNGVTAIPALGFQMISANRPFANKNLLKLVKRGCPLGMMNKLSLFNPNKIMETNQQVGRHSAAPIGEVKYPAKDVLLNLHYQYLSFEHTFNRRVDLNKKLGVYDKERGWGREYGWTREQLKTHWDYIEQNSIENVFSRHYNPHVQHSPLSERWWQKGRTHLENSGKPTGGFSFKRLFRLQR